MSRKPSLPRRPRNMPGRIRSKKQVNTAQFQCFWLSWGPGHESRITNHSWLWGGLCHACTWLAPPNLLPITWLVPGLYLVLGGFARPSCILHSSFCLCPSVALGGFPWQYRTLHSSTFSPDTHPMHSVCSPSRSLASLSSE